VANDCYPTCKPPTNVTVPHRIPDQPIPVIPGHALAVTGINALHVVTAGSLLVVVGLCIILALRDRRKAYSDD
jgi:hypothetical protein